MYRILTASKDTYITNKIINKSFRATDANVGNAGSLDLFKLYDENQLGSSSQQIELSRLLIKFPVNEISKMDSEGTIDINDNSFKCEVKLHDIYGGQTTSTERRDCCSGVYILRVNIVPPPVAKSRVPADCSIYL